MLRSGRWFSAFKRDLKGSTTATPFSGEIFSFTQPDGSSLAVRGWGDQHHALLETLAGYTVTRNPATGF